MTNRCDKHDVTSEGQCFRCEEDDRTMRELKRPRVIGEILLDSKQHPFARLRTGYDDNGDVWKPNTPIFAAPIEGKLYLAPSVSVTTEHMNEGFLKVNLELGKSRVTLHHFTQPDLGDPHDHPFPFTRTILSGGYVEEVWRMRNGEFFMQKHRRCVGHTSYVGDAEVHRIVELPDGECVTSIRWHDEGRERREPRFYQFDTGGRVRFRLWDQETWTEIRL